MKKSLLLPLFALLSIGLLGQTQRKWKKLNAGSTESGISGDPTLRFGVGTGFGANGDDVIVTSDEGVWKLNNNVLGSAVLLTTFPSGSKVNGIMKCSDGLIRIWGIFRISSSAYYGIMVSNAADPTSFSVQTNSLSTYQFGSHAAARGIVAFTEYSYGTPAQNGFMFYGPDLLTLNGTSVPSTVAFLNGTTGVVTDLPAFKPNTEERIIPTYPVTNPRIVFMAKRSNIFSTNGDLLIGGRYQTLGGVTYHGLISFSNTSLVLTDFNIASSTGNQAVTGYHSTSGREYIAWKSDNVATNGGITSSGLLEINSSNNIVGVSGGIANLQSNSLTTFDGRTWIGGYRYNPAQPANVYTYDGSVFTDSSGTSPNDLDNNGGEVIYDLFATPNFLYATGNFQTALGDVANFIAVRVSSAGPLASIFKSLSAERKNNLIKIYFEMYNDGYVTVEHSTDGTNFSSSAPVYTSANTPTTYNLSVSSSGMVYIRLKSANKYSQTIPLKKDGGSSIKVWRNNTSVMVTTPEKSQYSVFDFSGRLLYKGTVQSGTSFLNLPSNISGMVFISIETPSEKSVSKVFL
jgi:hypothetical protein